MTDSAIKKPVPSPAEPVPAEFDLLCEHCGYSLVGLIGSDRCPECGEWFDATLLPLARVPWLFRRRFGSWRAYFQTAWQVLLRPRRFATELYRPVRISVEDARLFRRRTARMNAAFVFIYGLAFVAYMIWYSQTMWRARLTIDQMVIAATAGALGCVVAALGTWGGLLLGTDLPTFIWKGLGDAPDKLAPAHHYASAPLALGPFAMLLLGVILGTVAIRAPSRLDLFNLWPPLVLIAVMLFLLVRTAVVFMRVATGCSPGRAAILALYLPLHWGLTAVLALMGSGVAFGSLSVVVRILAQFMGVDIG